MVRRKKKQKSVAGKAQGLETSSNKEGSKGDSRDRMEGEVAADKAQVKKPADSVQAGKSEVEILEMAKTLAKKRKRGPDKEMAESFFSSTEVGSSRLRPRKDIPSFRRVLLSEDDFDRIVGKRVKVFWPDSRKWFAGQIKSFDNGNKLHSILYDDGDKEQLNLMKEQFELQILPSEAFNILLKSEPCPEIPGNCVGIEDAVNEGLSNTKLKQSMCKQSEIDISLEKQETASGYKAESGDKDILEEGGEAKAKAQGSQSPPVKQGENDVSLVMQETTLDEGPDAKTSDSQTASNYQGPEKESQAKMESQENPVKKVQARAKAKT